MNRLLCFTFASLVTVGAVRAQDLPTGIAGSRQFQLEQVAPNHLRLTGEVEIDGPGGSWRFHADEANIYTDESLLVATGNVVFAGDTGRVAADRAEFHYEEGTGTFYNASGSTELVEDVELSMFGTQEAEMRFWGALIEKLGPRSYRLTDGGFTSCIQPTPRWEVRTSSAVIDLSEYARLRNMLLLVKGVPLFYLPWMYYPIQEDDRATGFLMPTYGASTVPGRVDQQRVLLGHQPQQRRHRLPRLAHHDRPGPGGRVPLRARAERARRRRGVPAERKRAARPVPRRRRDPAGPPQLPDARQPAALPHGSDPGAGQCRLLLGHRGAADVSERHLPGDQQLAHVRGQRDRLVERVHPERDRRFPGDVLRAGRLVASRGGGRASRSASRSGRSGPCPSTTASAANTPTCSRSRAAARA